MTKIALGMICKGEDQEAVKLERALSSIAPWVDSIYITLTGDPSKLADTQAVCQKYQANVSYNQSLWIADKKAISWLKHFLGHEPFMKKGDKIFVFDKARNYNFSQIPKEYDWITWIDSDDILRGGENLHEQAELAEKNNIEALYFNYIYHAEFDEKGEITHRIIEHLRERLIRNNGHFKWIAPIHETLIEQVPTQKTDSDKCDVLHLSTDKDKATSLTRNLKNLELAVYQSKGKDPRHLYYLAKAYFDLRDPIYDDRATKLILEYLNGENKSGWPEERQQAWNYLSEIFRRKNEINNSLKAALNAFTEPAMPIPDIFLNVAMSFILKKEYEIALFWVKQATSIPERKTTLVKNVKDIQGRVLEIIYNATLNLAQIDECWASAQKLLEMFPNEKTVQSAYEFIAHLKEQRDITMKMAQLATYLEKTGESHKLKPLTQAIPKIAEETPFMIELINKVNPPKEWAEDEIAIYCGPGFTSWSPKRLEDPKESFIGGSEEAVIKMSAALQKQDWKVTVFGDPGVDEGEYEGVQWLPYYKFNKQDNYNLLVVWRQIGFFDQEIKAKKSYLWLHDIANGLEFNETRLSRITKIMFLSNWHRENVPNLSEEKAMVTSNGI